MNENFMSKINSRMIAAEKDFAEKHRKLTELMENYKGHERILQHVKENLEVLHKDINITTYSYPPDRRYNVLAIEIPSHLTKEFIEEVVGIISEYSLRKGNQGYEVRKSDWKEEGQTVVRVCYRNYEEEDDEETTSTRANPVCY